MTLCLKLIPNIYSNNNNDNHDNHNNIRSITLTAGIAAGSETDCDLSPSPSSTVPPRIRSVTDLYTRVMIKQHNYNIITIIRQSYISRHHVISISLNVQNVTQ